METRCKHPSVSLRKIIGGLACLECAQKWRLPPEVCAITYALVDDLLDVIKRVTAIEAHILNTKLMKCYDCGAIHSPKAGFRIVDKEYCDRCAPVRIWEASQNEPWSTRDDIRAAFHASRLLEVPEWKQIWEGSPQEAKDEVIRHRF